jgi:tetratricopeptide (TPR) repeat protein
MTRALKMNLLRLEGEVDKVRTELGTLKRDAITPVPQEQVETSWIPMLNAEIVVSEAEQGGAPAQHNGTTNKKSLEEILDKIPGDALVQAGFGSRSAEESLSRLERELVGFGKQLNEAVRWVRKMRGGPEAADVPAFTEESQPEVLVYDNDTVKVKLEEIAKKVPVEQKPAQEPAKKSSSDAPTGKFSHPALKTDPVHRSRSTVRAGPMPFVAKPQNRLKPLLAVAVLLLVSLLGGAAAYYAFSERAVEPGAAHPSRLHEAMVPLAPRKKKPAEARPSPVPPPETKAAETMVAEIPSEAEDPRLQKARDLGLGYLAKKEYRKAEGFLAPWIQEAPDDPELHYLYGRVLFYLGRLKQSAEHLTRATELDPGFADAYFELGGVCMKLKWFAKAQEALTRFIQLRPNEPRAASVRNLIERNLK